MCLRTKAYKAYLILDVSLLGAKASSLIRLDHQVGSGATPEKTDNIAQ